VAKGKKTGGRNFEHGNRANPGGRPQLPADVKDAQSLTRVEFIRVINRYLFMSPSALVAVVENPATRNIDHIVCSIIVAAVKAGDPLRAEFILRRVLGDPPKVVEGAEPEEAKPELVPAMTKEQALELLKQREGKKSE
jgi:hypothetical protein